VSVGVLYRIDPLRSMGVLLLLGAGVFLAMWLAGLGLAPRRSMELGAAPSSGPRRFAVRGMLLMTALGLSSGLVGGLTEDALGDGALVRLLHLIFAVCWAPAWAMQRLRAAFVAHDAASRFLLEILGLTGFTLVPIVWFLVLLGLVHARGWLRRA
jgi:hypothetical protein